MDKSLSSKEILKILDVNLMTYQKLAKYDNIFDALGENKALVLLYETMEHYGHWVCLFSYKKGGKTVISFFDSYGIMPDSELLFIDEYFRKKSDQYLPHLTTLLLESNAIIEYNQYKFQKKSKKIATCGRWVIIRLLFRHLNVNEFYHFIQTLRKSPPPMTNDELVVYLTNF